MHHQLMLQHQHKRKLTKLSFAQSKNYAFVIKKSACNPIYYVYVMYADQENLMDMHIIFNVTKPLHMWHQCQHTANI